LAEKAKEAYRRLHTESEQALFAVDDLTEAFEELGYAVPTSTDSFIELVDGIDTTTDAGLELYQELLSLAGGFLAVEATALATKEALEEEALAAQTVYRSLHTESAQSLFALQDITKEFEDLGYALPNTKADLIKLVDGIDTTSDAGLELYYGLLSIADAFMEVESSAEAAAETGRQQANDHYDMMLAESKVIEQREREAEQKEINDIYNDAMDIYNDTIAELENLIKSLEQLSDTISDKIDYYKNGAEDSVITAADIGIIIGEVQSSSTEDLVDVTYESIKMIEEYYKQQTSIFNSLLDALDQIQDYVDKSRLGTEDLNEARKNYRFYFERVIFALEDMESENIGNLVGLLTSSMDSYLGILQGTAQTTAEYEYEKNVMLNELEGVAEGGDPLIEAIETLRIQTVSWLESINNSVMAVSLNVTYELENTTPPPSPPEDTSWQLTPNEQTVTDAYRKYLGVTNVDSASLAYWTNELNVPGGVDHNNLGESLAAAAVMDGSMSKIDFVSLLYTYGLGRAAAPAELNYWAYESATPAPQMASLFAGLDNTYVHFAEGGLVKGGRGGTIGLIGEKNYDELVVPLKDSNDPLGQNKLIKTLKEEMKLLRDEIVALKDEVSVGTKAQNTTARNTRIKRLVVEDAV